MNNNVTVIRKRGRPKKNTDSELTSWDYKPPAFFYERLTPKSKAELDNLGLELLAYDTKFKPLILSKFFVEREHALTMSDVYKWAQTENGLGLKKALDVVRARIQVRREESALNYKIHAGIFAMKEPLYDPEYRAYKIELETKKNENNKTFHITMPVIDTPKNDDGEK